MYSLELQTIVTILASITPCVFNVSYGFLNYCLVFISHCRRPSRTLAGQVWRWQTLAAGYLGMLYFLLHLTAVFHLVLWIYQPSGQVSHDTSDCLMGVMRIYNPVCMICSSWFSRSYCLLKISVSQYGSEFIFLGSLLSLLDVCGASFHLPWEHFNHISSNILSAPMFSFWDSHSVDVGSLNGVLQVTKVLFRFLPVVFFFCFFRLSNFQYLIFSPACPNLPLNPSCEFSISFILFCSRIFWILRVPISIDISILFRNFSTSSFGSFDCL